MSTHRFILADDRTTGRQTISAYTATEVTQEFGTYGLSRFATGRPVIVDGKEHVEFVDLLAFYYAHRAAPGPMPSSISLPPMPGLLRRAS
jgi:hypothetical protein